MRTPIAGEIENLGAGAEVADGAVPSTLSSIRYVHAPRHGIVGRRDPWGEF